MDNQLQNAIKLAQAGKFSEAKSLLEELLKDSPDNSEILYNLGMCYTELGNPDRAIETLKKGLNDVNNPDTKYTLNTMKGEFTGLQLVCYMFVGFKSFAPEQDVGMDFSEEYRMAQEFYQK